MTRDTDSESLYTSKKRVLSNILASINIPNKTLTDEEFRLFDDVFRGTTVVDTVGSLLIFLARHRHHNFMVETTGNRFDEKWSRSVFGDVHSILQAVYVSSVDTLIDRVSKRANQLINATPERIRDTYRNSYYDNIQAALRSGIFNEINVTSNDTKPSKTMIKLWKSNERHGYVMHVNPPETLNDEEYRFIIGILTSVGLYESFIHYHRHDSRSLKAFFCSHTFNWTGNLKGSESLIS